MPTFHELIYYCAINFFFQQMHDIVMMSHFRPCDVMSSHRQYDALGGWLFGVKQTFETVFQSISNSSERRSSRLPDRG